jgi:hypothetical protein
MASLCTGAAYLLGARDPVSAQAFILTQLGLRPGSDVVDTFHQTVQRLAGISAFSIRQSSHSPQRRAQ